ncbi:unnamed protein product [Schistosoma mattheei]|uniref:Reverse transcriptase domain-containing protein n=1 Tax=Schistosoma mattheei TaxID=31246 RepID=A0A3P8GR49_9TREM|nr:unnamed protein product [Schistosoma mattheei]
MNRMKDAVDTQLRDQQAGFHRDRLCTDQIATLRTIVEQSFLNGTRYYTSTSLTIRRRLAM